MAEEQKKIKLSAEQILAREVQLETTKLDVEMAELNAKRVESLIESDFYKKQAQSQLNELKKKIEVGKHNIVALTQQITTGEL